MSQNLTSPSTSAERYPDRISGYCDTNLVHFEIKHPIPKQTRYAIRTFPDPILRQKAQDLGDYDPHMLSDCAAHMARLMYDQHGIGLAANQAGLRHNMFVAQLDELYPAPLLFINPRITACEGSTTEEEGCLSLPDIRAKIKRAQRIEFKAHTLNGEEYRLNASDLFAVCVQHELDHLNGVVFIDYLSKLKREIYLRKLHKLKKATQQ